MTTELSEFHLRAAEVAVTKMLSGTHFSICDLDKLAKLLGRSTFMAGPDYHALSSLHCVDWADMGPELTQHVRSKCLELLGVSFVHEEPVPATSQPEVKPRFKLAFWRQA